MRTGRPRLDNYHGTIAGYRTYGCRCDDCRATHRRAVTDWRIRSKASAQRATKDQPAIRQTVPAAPVMAHIAQLRASGYTLDAIAADCGVSAAALGRIARGDRERVLRRTANAVLTVSPLPDLTDYIDPVVVDRLIAGADWQAIGATRAERIAAAERLAWHWTPIRARQQADGTAPQYLDGESLTSIERRFSLRAGRDFRKAPDAEAQRGAA